MLFTVLLYVLPVLGLLLVVLVLGRAHHPGPPDD